eukprot:TRINITY_DN5412_c1_g1_i1.p1 TRINITY_DN5412_c1_g1~~TRINITY_DN5412_c1_g1_i1.p1  ORF type:complete len:467 (+),score=123.00 TRINITY_DN5412_c1_g1_i1:85-1485(+)
MGSVEKEWEQIQKKAFTHWINSILERRNQTISSIEEEFKTGVKLLIFLEILTVQEIPKWNKIARHKLHYIENNNIALNFLKAQGVKDLSIGAEEIVDGNLKMLLGMCWVLLRHFGKIQVSSGTAKEEDDGTSFEDSMLKWLFSEISDYNLDVSNFRTSFNDGKVFLALCHKLHPDSVDYHNLDMSDPVANSNLAFKIGEERLRVPSLLNAENLAEGKEKEKSVVLYLSLLYNAYTNETDKRKLAGVSETKTLSLQEQITLLEEENVSLKETLHELTEKVEEMEKVKEETVEEKIVMSQSKDETVVKVSQEREQLKAGNEKLEREKEAMEAEKEELLKQIRRSEKQREQLEEALRQAKQESKSSLDDLEKALAVHLQQLHVWKDYFKEEGKLYEGETIAATKEKQIHDRDMFAQLASIAQSLAHEDLKLGVLQKERETKEAQEREAKQIIAKREKAKKEEERKNKKS